MDQDAFHSVWGTSGVAAPTAAPEATGTRTLDPKSFDDMWLKTSPEPKGKEPVTRPGALGNKPDDGIWAPLKNIATGAIKGVGNSIGAVGNMANMADYLLARAEAAATGKPIDEVLASFAEKKRAQAENP